MKQDNFKAPPGPPIEKDDNNVYNFKCEKCDTKYRSVVILRIHKTKQHKQVLELQCQQCEFEANLEHGNLDRHISMQHKMMRIIRNKTI